MIIIVCSLILFFSCQRKLELTDTEICIFKSCLGAAIPSWVLTNTLWSSCVLLKDTTQCCQWYLNPGPLDLEPNARPLNSPLCFDISRPLLANLARQLPELDFFY